MDPKCNDINPNKMEEGDFTHTHTHKHQHDIKTEQRGAGLENWNDAATRQGMPPAARSRETKGAHP